MNVLLSAFACDPKMGSEPYVGWNWLHILLNVSDRVTLLTRKHHEEALLSTVGSNPKLTIIAFDIFGLKDLDHRSRLMKPYYMLWQLVALFYALSATSKAKFDFAMHTTYNVVDFPGLLWLLKDVPFVWGPVGGGQCPPNWAEPLYGSGWKRQKIRRFIKSTICINPLVLAAVAKSKFILVANVATSRVLPAFGRAKYFPMLETAIDGQISDIADSRPDASPSFRLLWVGQLEARKALTLLLDALVLVRHLHADVFRQLSLTVVGTGADREMLTRYSEVLNLSSTVSFAGSVKFKEMREHYASSDAFIFTSVQDTSGNVVLEALANGLPVVALNHQGVAEMVNSECALLVSAEAYDEAVYGFARHIIRLVKDPTLRSVIGQRGLAHVKEFHTWKCRQADFQRLLNDFFPSTKDPVVA